MSREVGGYQELESIFTDRIIVNRWYEKSNLGWEKEYWTKTFEKKAFHFFKKRVASRKVWEESLEWLKIEEKA